MLTCECFRQRIRDGVEVNSLTTPTDPSIPGDLRLPGLSSGPLADWADYNRKEKWPVMTRHTSVTPRNSVP